MGLDMITPSDIAFLVGKKVIDITFDYKLNGYGIDIRGYTKVPSNKSGVFTYTTSGIISSIRPGMLAMFVPNEKLLELSELTYAGAIMLNGNTSPIVLQSRPLEPIGNLESLGTLIILR